MLNNLVAKITYKLRRKENMLENPDQVFVYESNGVNINPKYIAPEDYQHLLSFEQFVKNHNEMTDKEISDFIGTTDETFVSKLNKLIPNFVNELRKNGAKAVALIYISEKLYAKKDMKEV